MESIQNSLAVDDDTKRRKRVQKERERVQRVAEAYGTLYNAKKTNRFYRLLATLSWISTHGLAN